MTEARFTFTEEHLKHVTLILKRVKGKVTLESEGEPERLKVLMDGSDEVKAKALYDKVKKDYQDRSA